MVHDGKTDIRDQAHIRHWGTIYKARIGRPHFQPTSRYDATMQRAVAEVQKLTGLAVTGLLGPEEWAMVHTMARPKGTWVKPKGPFAEIQAAQHRKNVRKYWDRYSKWNINPGSDPAAPDWYPGRIFGRFERGPHVNPVRAYFGMTQNGCFNSVVAQRVRGFQKRMGLPVSGFVDAYTATLIQDEIDKLQAKAVEDAPTP